MSESVDKFDLILAELKELRDETKSNGERLARVETQMCSLVGNGQPGRIGLLERAVESLSRWRWWVVGAAAGASTVISAVAWIVTEASKK